MRKRISTILLALAIVVTSLPALAFAEAEESLDNTPVVTSEEEAVVDSEEIVFDGEEEAVEEDIPAIEEEQAEEEQAEELFTEEPYEEEAVEEEAVEEQAEEPVQDYSSEVRVLKEDTPEVGDVVETTGDEEVQNGIIVSDLSVSSKTMKTVTLTWQLMKNGELYTVSDIAKLAVYRGNANGEKFKLQDVEITFDGETYKTKVKGLKPGTKYTFKVKEKTNKNKTSIVVTTKKAVGDVKGFKALSTYNGVILKWKKVKSATGYTINWKSGKKKGKITIKKGTKIQYLHKLPASLRSKRITYSIVANKKGTGSSTNKATVKGEAVRTMHWTVYLSTTRTLTSHDKAQVTRTFPAGTKIDAYGYEGGRYVFDYKGHVFYVKRVSCTGQEISQSDFDRMYSKTEAESFVNKRGLKSSTKNLIWVNTYTQTLYVFKGSKGKWKLIKGPWEVSTGAPKTPTSTGLARVRSKSVGCQDPFPQTPWWCVASEYSIHGKAPYYPAMGAPYSHGCVRNWTKNAKWMYDNIPINTAIYVF